MFRAFEGSYDSEVQGDSSSFSYTAQATSFLQQLRDRNTLDVISFLNQQPTRTAARTLSELTFVNLMLSLNEPNHRAMFNSVKNKPYLMTQIYTIGCNC